MAKLSLLVKHSQKESQISVDQKSVCQAFGEGPTTSLGLDQQGGLCHIRRLSLLTIQSSSVNVTI